MREAILSVMPDAAEKVYFGWRGLGFHHPTAGYLCAIFPSQKDIKIGFEPTNLLHDPDQRLEGTGKQVRYLTVSAWDPALPEVLTISSTKQSSSADDHAGLVISWATPAHRGVIQCPGTWVA